MSKRHHKERGSDKGNILQLMFDSPVSSSFSWILFQSSVDYEFAPRRCLPILLHLLYATNRVNANTHTQIDNLLTPTVFDLCDIPHHYVSHGQLYDLATADNLEFLLLLDAALQPTELLLLRPVVEGCHQHHTHHGQQDSCALDPAGIRLALILYPTCRCAAGYSLQ